ncbi:hypothetical protein BDW66DRAFT_143401 [Aspergillus desertorum]
MGTLLACCFYSCILFASLAGSWWGSYPDPCRAVTAVGAPGHICPNSCTNEKTISKQNKDLDLSYRFVLMLGLL